MKRWRLSKSAPGYRRKLEQENTPEAQARVENLNELMNAAAEAVERGESVRDFLDHAALVAQADDIDEGSQITLMTIHNAKGLEFPVVFMAGMEDGLFPHSRSLAQRSRNGRGAPSLLRGDDALGKASRSELGAVSSALRRWRSMERTRWLRGFCVRLPSNLT